MAAARPHLGWSINLPRRLLRLLLSAHSGSGAPRGSFREGIVNASCWPTGSKLENWLLLYELAKTHFPDDYQRTLKLRMPWFVGLKASDPFPRLELANRIPRHSGALFGPFRTRDDAQVYEQEVLGLFQIRRCTETLAPHPEHPGCIYGEMNQCARPCQCAVSAAEYASEAGRVAEFLAANGKNSLTALKLARERACEQLEFEEAGQIQKRIEKVESAGSARDPAIRAVDDFNGVALTASAGPMEVRLWPMLRGVWQEPVTLDFSAERSHSRSLDFEIRDKLSSVLAKPDTSGNKLEQLAIFSRWYYSSWRDGRWFPFQTLTDLNYRGLVRQISKMAEEARKSSIVADKPC